ncbi:MAG: glycosyltransferase [Syntrophales bacterium]|nr:glycosyltransferase [Syntrophales bacterium]
MRSECMKIAFFGSSLVSAYWNGAATYYRGIIRELDLRGHRVTFYEPDAYGRQQHRDIPDPAWARVVVYEASRPGVDSALEEAGQADLIVKASGVGVFDEYLESAVLEKAPASVIFWDVDAPATLDRIGRNRNDPFRLLIPRYDLILTYGGGEPVAGAYRQYGARDCVPVYNALDSTTHYPVPASSRFAADLGFLGNRLPDREKRVEEFLFRAAERCPGRSFLLGGSGWEERSLPANVRLLGHVYTDEHNEFNSSVGAVLNISRESMACYGYCPATRVFEAAGAGSCIISDWWEGMEIFLDPGREVITVRGGDEVAEALERLTPGGAKRIGEAARRRVLAQHTYRHRAEQLEMLFNGGIR